ncbi:stress-induced protein [Streptococcus pseudopneumoniae]|uniref:Stress-induced protein n=1 Tax=Streptococcus pseudopneumoniae TaxID=257758 RepID=A0A3A4N1N3_9STRE|nr:stress-induced protein [Streptococcus pseudopneumoniae]RJP07644.1 stress-induced protein [Streptococcus pseudopneumoniae]
MPRDGTENLIPVTERTKKEAREISRKGGIASGKARREKANLKKKVNEILSMDVFSPQFKEMLEEKGLSVTNQTAIATVLLQKALKGDMRAIELLVKMNGNEGTKDSLDKKEQKERIEALKLGNEKLRKQIGTSEVDVKDDGFIKSLEGVVEETWLD